MTRKVAIGIQDFEKIIVNHYFYIDKTEFIKEWWESGDDVTLITRPRRFGKTLNMNMLDYFFSLNHADRGDLFEGLSIWKEEKYRNLQGTYPVINLTFARVKETNYKAAEWKICEILRNLYIEYSFLRDSEVLTEADRVFFDSILSFDINPVHVSSALLQLSNFLYRYYGKKVIILLDEYDTPMQEAYLNGFWEDIVSFIRNFFNTTFKTNPYLERGIMTGITRVSKESIFSDLNHLKVVTTTSNEYAEYFGFTEEEVFKSLDEYGMEKEKKGVKYWYDGFVFGNQKDIYNPWSVLNFLDTGRYGAYWANTSSNGLVGKLIREANKNTKIMFETLLKGKSIRCPIDEQIVYNRLDDNTYAIWSLLVASGYLKVLEVERAELFDDGRSPNYEMELTNYEVKCMFLNMAEEWFGKVNSDYQDFVTALLEGDIDAMNICMNRMTLNIFSYFDVGNRPSGIEPERFYHGFVLGLLASLQREYILTSNRESGFGRYDIMIEPKDKSKGAVIVEFKVFNPKREKTLEDTVVAALKQIEDKKYESVLVSHGISLERIQKYGFAFAGKEVLIG